ncbi:ATP-binding protein, partial [Streptomyces sp. NPDC093516]
MDPNTRGPEEYGHEGDGQGPRQRPPRESLTPDFGQHAPALARTVQLVSGDFLLTVNPVAALPGLPRLAGEPGPGGVRPGLAPGAGRGGTD